MRVTLGLLTAITFLGSCSRHREPLVLGESLMVQADELAGSMETVKISIIDVRPEADFLAGHIPGAVNIWRPQMADTSFSWTSITAPREQLEQYFGSVGLRPGEPVVIYDHNKLTDACNLAWIFDLHGKKDVGVLEGGFVAWQQQEYPTEQGPSRYPTTSFSFPSPDDSSAYAGMTAIHKAIDAPGSLIVDVRSWGEHTGEDVMEGAGRGGRIPHSTWFDYKELLVEREGAFYLRSKTEMQTLLTAKGITQDRDIIAYCQSGVRSANFTCILRSVLGYPSVRNYDGSWEEWSAQEGLPAEAGEPGGGSSLAP